MFVVLVLSKVHAVAKNGLVAAYVEGSETLIAANAQLGRVAAVSVVLVAGPGVLRLKLGSAELVLYLSALVYLGSTLLNLRLPKPRSDHVPQIVPAEDAALARGRVPSLATAAAGTACLRAAQGFLLFLMAFSLRTAGKPPYWLGSLIFAGILGAYVGDVLGPRLRPGLRGETVVLGSLLLAGAAALFALSAYSLPSLMLFSFLAGGATELGQARVPEPDAARDPRRPVGPRLRPVRGGVPARVGRPARCCRRCSRSRSGAASSCWPSSTWGSARRS